jgi:nucleoside-diphosphate-sugar epimerase
VRGDVRPMREVFGYVRRLLPDAEMTLQPGRDRQTWQVDGSATCDEIGYAPTCTIEEGIKRNINRLRQQAGLSPVA